MASPRRRPGRPLGEGGAVVSLLTEAHGRHAGLARGGASRAQAPVWQAGNLVEARWVARLADQLGASRNERVCCAFGRACVVTGKGRKLAV